MTTVPDENSFNSNKRNISKVFDELENLENKMKENLKTPETPIRTFLSENYAEASQDSIGVGCGSLPDYVLVTSMVTETFPVHTTPATTHGQAGDTQGLDIPVRRGKQQHKQIISRAIPIQQIGDQES